MINRIPNIQLPPQRSAQPSPLAIQEWQRLAHRQITGRLRQVESFVQAHPVTGIGAASRFSAGLTYAQVME